MTYQVGRWQGNRLVPAFKIDRTKGGGITITDAVKLNSAERMVVLGWFGRELRARVSSGMQQHMRRFTPGTKSHFDRAVRQLPAPFLIMRPQ